MNVRGGDPIRDGTRQSWINGFGSAIKSLSEATGEMNTSIALRNTTIGMTKDYMDTYVTLLRNLKEQGIVYPGRHLEEFNEIPSENLFSHYYVTLQDAYIQNPRATHSISTIPAGGDSSLEKTETRKDLLIF